MPSKKGREKGEEKEGEERRGREGEETYCPYNYRNVGLRDGSEVKRSCYCRKLRFHSPGIQSCLW